MNAEPPVQAKFSTARVMAAMRLFAVLFLLYINLQGKLMKVLMIVLDTVRRDFLTVAHGR
jgi:hypothetical protein